jgi:hypothetical protein
MRLAPFNAIRRSRALHKVPSHNILAPVSIAVVLFGALVTDATAQAPAAAPAAAASAPAMKPLGGERYQIGKIVVDRKARTLSVQGKLIHIDDAPLEYLAVGRAGPKAYESLLELDTVGTEFNLACILLGLDKSERRRPDFQFDRRPPEGPQVLIDLEWQADGRTIRLPAQDVLSIGEAPGSESKTAVPKSDWVYIGSIDPQGDKLFAADVTGTIIGFVHDPASIIEHREGLGIGAYGSIQGNSAVLPPVGSDVRLVITVPEVNARKK